MKLISEALFKQFTNPDYDHGYELKKKQVEILGSKNIPDDLKAILFYGKLKIIASSMN